jgi:preprotein translocase subunit SecE
VRKVVWPTRKETMQTTLVILAMVTVMGLLMWAFDALLAVMVRTLTG